MRPPTRCHRQIACRRKHLLAAQLQHELVVRLLRLQCRHQGLLHQSTALALCLHRMLPAVPAENQTASGSRGAVAEGCQCPTGCLHRS